PCRIRHRRGITNGHSHIQRTTTALRARLSPACMPQSEAVTRMASPHVTVRLENPIHSTTSSSNSIRQLSQLELLERHLQRFGAPPTCVLPCERPSPAY